MQSKILLSCMAFFILSIFGFEKSPENIKIQKEVCIDCDEVMWRKAEIYLSKLKKENIKKIRKKANQIDSLGVIIDIKDDIISVQKGKINSLKSELSTKPKEIIRIDTVKVLIKEKKSFWGGTKTDTIK